MEHLYNLIPLLLLVASGIVVLAFDNLLYSLAGLAATYLATFFLIIQTVAPGLAFVKLVTGLMACGLIFVSRSEIAEIPKDPSLANRVFKVTALVVVWLVIFLSAGISGRFFR